MQAPAVKMPDIIRQGKIDGIKEAKYQAKDNQIYLRTKDSFT